MLLINASRTLHRDISLLQWCDVWLWQPLDSNYKTYHYSLTLKLWSIFLLTPICMGLFFLSLLVLAGFYTLNYLFWYIYDDDVFYAFNMVPIVLMILCWCCQCFLNLLLVFNFSSFSIPFSYVDISIIFFLLLFYVLIMYFGKGLWLLKSLHLMWCWEEKFSEFVDFLCINYVGFW